MRLGIFILILILLQVFTFGLGKSLQWLFAPLVGKRGRSLLMVLAYVLTNAILLGVVLQMTGYLEMKVLLFRMMAMWMVVLLYVMYAALATFLLYLMLRKIMDKPPLSRSLRVFAPLFFIGLMVLSVYNAYVPVVHHQVVSINKKMGKPLRIGLASDTHLGEWFGANQLDKLADIMKQEAVDIILLPGDLMDDNVIAYRSQNMQPHLQKLNAPLGVYATLGNHDLFGSERQIKEELEKAGIRVLENEALETNGLLLVGRNDDLDFLRPTTEQLLIGQNTRLPVLLMDHRPNDIHLHQHLPIDIQVSGHVHNGQVAPANLIVRALNRLAYGYEAIGNGHYFVTSGYGFWGIPMRLGSQSEVWIIDVQGM
ncbi:metallophosphoesterase [Neisseria animalis]|uniref:Metallophosphoesterase n=1 Tax=Neisseria animalis TaxID=492 RepID=A0A5P3MWF7_NEIAN|nr:metallophosphoesterase [Neisseria animalis]QEY25091.1 metallophosphoesterase [Neisseria animalis]ROW32517.1 metallophosphoesterase [Neisseria animalis]VEE08023.1 Uncharacterized metallophosphoesterase Cj0846 [Neisseria animalis]